VTRSTRTKKTALLLGTSLLYLAAAPGPACADFFSLTLPTSLECQVRSHLAEDVGDHTGAIAWAESLAQVDPRSSYACSRVALLHEEVGEDVIALEWGERALARDSLNQEAAMLVGRMRLRSGEPSRAVQVLTPPLRQLGAMPELFALRALAHELERNFEAALADLRRTDVLLPDFAWIATGILSLALEDGRWEEANSALHLALELKPDDARTLSLGVSLAQHTGNLEMEETFLRELALVQDTRPETLARYGAFLVGAGRVNDFESLLAWSERHGFKQDDGRVDVAHELLGAGKYREALLVVKPLSRDPRSIPVRARAHLALGEERKSLQDYRRLIPGRTLVREESLIVAYLEIRVGDRKSGIRTLEAVRLRPLESPRQVLAASLCYSLLGHPEDALGVIRESASRGLSSPSMYEELGSTATELGDSLLAQWAWERLRDMGRETSECLYFLASAELGRGEQGRAIETLNRSIQLNARNGKALLLLGKLRHRQGQLEMARETLIRAAQCPEAAAEANRELARVCRTLRLDSEAREAEARARASRPAQPGGLSLFQSR
jgi:tetratricopeptide (TPR) repeat protein